MVEYSDAFELLAHIEANNDRFNFQRNKYFDFSDDRMVWGAIKEYLGDSCQFRKVMIFHFGRGKKSKSHELKKISSSNSRSSLDITLRDEVCVKQYLVYDRGWGQLMVVYTCENYERNFIERKAYIVPNKGRWRD